MGRRRRRRRGFFSRLGRTVSRVFRRRRRRSSVRRPTPKPKVKAVTTTPKPVSLPLGSTTKMSSKELTMLMKENCMGRYSVPGNDGNLLIDTSKPSRKGKWYPGEYRVTVKREDDKNIYGSTLLTITEEGQATINYKPAETVVSVLDSAFVIKETKDIEPPPPLPDVPEMPPPPLPKFNQPDNSAAPVGKRRGYWKTIVPIVKRSEHMMIPPNRNFEYNKEYIFRIVPYEKAPDYLWIKRFLGNPDYIEGFGNDLAMQTPSPPLGIERGDYIFHTKVDKKDTVWRSYEGAAKYFISRKPTKGHILITDLKVSDITDVPIIREDFTKNMNTDVRGYVGGKAGEVQLDLYDSTHDAVFKERGDKGIGGEVPVSPNVIKWALPSIYNDPELFNYDSETYYGAEELGLSGTVGSADEWDYLTGKANDIKERKQFKRYRQRHPKKVFRRILRQQDSTIRRLELKHGKLKPSVKRNIKKSLVRKRMSRRMSIWGSNRRRLKRKNIPFWKSGGRTKYGFSKRRRGRNPFHRQRRQRRGSIIN